VVGSALLKRVEHYCKRILQPFNGISDAETAPCRFNVAPLLM
jgi:hypothetical protein